MKRALVLPVLSVTTISLVCLATLWYGSTRGNFASGVSWLSAKPRRIPRPATGRQQVVNFKEELPGLTVPENESKSIPLGPQNVQENSLQKVLTSLVPDGSHKDVNINTRSSRFLYLSQTESCLPIELQSVEIIGNTSACQCDVLVLSYKQACGKTPPKHVQYLFNSSTSWASGRNLLYKEAKKRGNVYLYYIFIDDDIGLRTKAHDANPWRQFEQFLKEIEPAVAAVDTDTNGMVQQTLAGRKQKKCSLKQISDYVPVARFDPAFNAYHYEAAEYLLPYTTRYDKTSWWYPDLYFEVKCELMFAGQTVIHTQVTATNPKHRPYPRGNPSVSQWATLVKQVAAELPEQYRNVSLLSEWKSDGIDHRRKSSTLCLPPPPPHMPIRPFAYLDGKI